MGRPPLCWHRNLTGLLLPVLVWWWWVGVRVPHLGLSAPPPFSTYTHHTHTHTPLKGQISHDGAAITTAIMGGARPSCKRVASLSIAIMVIAPSRHARVSDLLWMECMKASSAGLTYW